MRTSQERGLSERAVGPDLVLVTGEEGSGAVVSVQGELDAYSAAGLEAEVGKLLGRRVQKVALDLSGTRFCDSSGLRAILTVERRLASAGGHLTLREPSEPVRRLLDVSGLLSHFDVEPVS